MNREYVALFNTVGQTSPDDFETVTRTLKVTDTTTIGEIRQWYADAIHENPLRPELMQIKISELEQVPANQPA